MFVLHLLKGSKVFWRANAAVDFYLFEHLNSDIVEVIGYNTGIFLEFEHIYLIKSVLFDIAAKEATKRKTVKGKHTSAHRETSSLKGPRDHTHVAGHSHRQTHAEKHDQQAENLELLDKLAGDYVINHIVYVHGSAHHPPIIKFVSGLEDLPDGTEAPFIAEKPVEYVPIARPVNQRDRSLMEAQQHGKTSDEIERLKRQAEEYLDKAAALLHLDLDQHLDHHDDNDEPSHKLKGMMDMDDPGNAEDDTWATPHRLLDVSRLPPLPGEHHKESPHDKHEEVHLPDITSSHKEAVSRPHLFAASSGLIREGHELHKVFKAYCSEKYGHEEMDVYEFKKMCRELHLTNAKFNTGTAEALFRKTLDSAPVADGEEEARREHRLRFGSFPALLKGIAHERVILYDAVVNILLNSFEQSHTWKPH